MENQPKENNYENQASQRDEAPTDTELKEANNENLPIEEVNDVNKELEINRENELQEEKNEEKEEPNDEEIVDNLHEAVLINKEVHEKEENIQDIKDNKEEEDPRENNEHYEEGEGEPEELEHNEEIEENQEEANNEDYEVDEPQQSQEYQERQGIHIHRKEEEDQEKEIQDEENMENKGEIHPMEPVDSNEKERESEVYNEEVRKFVEEGIEENNEQEEEYEEDNENNVHEVNRSDTIDNQKVKIIIEQNENFNNDIIKEIPRMMVFKKPKKEFNKRIVEQEEEKEQENINRNIYKAHVEIPKEKIKIYETKEIIVLKGGIETGKYQFIGEESQLSIQEASAKIEINQEEILNEINRRNNKQKKYSYEVVDKYYSLTVFEAKEEQTIKALKEKQEKIKAEINLKIPNDNFSKYILEQINKIRADPQSFIGVIEDAKDNIKKSRKGKYYYSGNKIKVALKEGESAFNETIEFLKTCQPMNPLEFSKDLIPTPPQNEEEIEDRNYLKKNVELMILNGKKINSYWRTLINDAEICFLLMIVDDNGDKKGMRRNDILNPKMKNIGISSVEINGQFVNYFVLSS